MSNIGIIGDFSTRYAIKGGATRVFSVYLKVAPSADVTVSFASVGSKFTVTASLTFTALNYATAQAVTITAVNTGTHGYLTDTLNVTCSGGGYDSQAASKTVIINDAGLNPFFLVGFNWKEGIDYSLSASQASVIESFVYNGSSKPSNATPTSVTTSYTGTMHANNDGQTEFADFTGIDSITQVVFTATDRNGGVWTYYQYHFFNSNRTSDICCFVCLGHGSEGKATTIEILQNRIDNGYDVVFTAMPKGAYTGTGSNSETSSVNDHSNLYTGGVATDAVPQLFLFHSDKIQMLNYLDANFDYDSYAIVGISGGGWTATTIGSYETRFTITACVRGIRHRKFKRTESLTRTGSESDYEQMGNDGGVYVNCGVGLYNFLSTNSYVNMAALCATTGRKYLHTNHGDDVVVELSGYDCNLFGPEIELLATQLGGEAHVYCDSDGARTAHVYDSFSIGKIEELFGD